jgi:hypothetical protein
LGEILFDKLGIEGGKKTATGQYATGEAILEQLDHPIVAIILEHRSLSKLKGTYTDTLPKMANPVTKRMSIPLIIKPSRQRGVYRLPTLTYKTFRFVAAKAAKFAKLLLPQRVIN